MKLPYLALAAALVLAVPQEEGRKAPPAPEVGKPAPTFRLNDHQGAVVSVGPTDEATWTVLAFFPKAATPG